MRRLPPISADRNAYELPLSDATASGLIKALLMDEPALQHASLRSLLSIDPSLTLWSLCQSRNTASHPIRRMSDLASWLSLHAIERLVWTDDTSTTTTTTTTVDNEWPQLAATSVMVATTAAKLAEADHDSDAAHLLGLVHAAGRWLNLSAANDAESSRNENLKSILPTWLVDSLSLLAEETSQESPACHVQAAIRSNENRQIKNGHCDDISNAIGGAIKHWSTSNPECVDVLRGLLRKLTRLQSLENDFESSLQREKIAAMKELAYGASHEINNPLANISTRAQTLLRDETDPERRRKLETINRQAFRAHEMITHMMQFARPPRLKPCRRDLVILIDEAIAALAADADEQRTEVVNRSDVKHVFAVVDPTQLGVAIKAMVINALEAIRKGGRVEVSARAVESAAEIVIRDNGPGIAPEIQRHLFDPFFSGREAGRGLGFGLCTCWGVVEQHGGNIAVDSRRDVGTTFTIRLPEKAHHDECLVTNVK